MNLKDKFLAFDTETTGLSPYGDLAQWGFYPARPFAFSFSDTEFETQYHRFEVNPMNREVLYKGIPSGFCVPQTQWKTIAIKTTLEDPSTAKIGHNIGFDIRMARAI